MTHTTEQRNAAATALAQAITAQRRHDRTNPDHVDLVKGEWRHATRLVREYVESFDSHRGDNVTALYDYVFDQANLQADLADMVDGVNA